MKSPLNNRWLQAAASLFAGLLATISLLLSVQLFSANQNVTQDKRPLLVVDLVNWKPTEKPIEKKQAPPPKKVFPPKQKKQPKPKPIKKESIKPVEKIALNPVKKVVPEAETTKEISPEPVTQKKIETVTEKVLPTPVPIFQLSDMPQYLHKETPVYPPAMRTLGKTATVKLEAYIDKTGSVRKITIVKSAGEEFDQAAKKAIWASTFSPAKADGKAVAVLLRLPVKFNLR